MQCVADIVRYAVEHRVINKEDLYTVESNVLNKISRHEECLMLWEKYKKYTNVIISKDKPQNEYFINVDAKRRYINPYTEGKRLSEHYNDIKLIIEEFTNRDFNYWVGAK